MKVMNQGQVCPEIGILFSSKNHKMIQNSKSNPRYKFYSMGFTLWLLDFPTNA